MGGGSGVEGQEWHPAPDYGSMEESTQGWLRFRCVCTFFLLVSFAGYRQHADGRYNCLHQFYLELLVGLDVTVTWRAALHTAWVS